MELLEKETQHGQKSNKVNGVESKCTSKSLNSRNNFKILHPHRNCQVEQTWPWKPSFRIWSQVYYDYWHRNDWKALIMFWWKLKLLLSPRLSIKWYSNPLIGCRDIHLAGGQKHRRMKRNLSGILTQTVGILKPRLGDKLRCLDTRKMRVDQIVRICAFIFSVCVGGLLSNYIVYSCTDVLGRLFPSSVCNLAATLQLSTGEQGTLRCSIAVKMGSRVPLSNLWWL